ncbi:hypothetical protein [Phytohabitans kaempferiae]|uniref:Uncharacterized protein n=1 Tax=Phytohabitans kaempferiae TaxID=1620943 RepID=A0ABV6M9T3_9ACTN
MASSVEERGSTGFFSESDEVADVGVVASERRDQGCADGVLVRVDAAIVAPSAMDIGGEAAGEAAVRTSVTWIDGDRGAEVRSVRSLPVRSGYADRVRVDDPVALAADHDDGPEDDMDAVLGLGHLVALRADR